MNVETRDFLRVVAGSFAETKLRAHREAAERTRVAALVRRISTVQSIAATLAMLLFARGLDAYETALPHWDHERWAMYGRAAEAADRYADGACSIDDWHTAWPILRSAGGAPYCICPPGFLGKLQTVVPEDGRADQPVLIGVRR
jgi:hypothetical protein